MDRSFRIQRLLLRIFLILTAAGAAGLSAEVRLEADSLFIESQEWSEPLTPLEVTELALRASGLDETGSVPYMKEMENRLKVFQRDILPQWESLGDYEKGEALLLWLHEESLQQYVETQTRLDTLMDQGIYNCVSSSVYFIIFSLQSGLDVQGVETRDHAFCRINTSDTGVDVETTTPHGFDPGTKKEFTQSFNRTGFTYVPPGNYRNRSESSLREMIALILQNRMAQLQRNNRHAEAVGLGVDRWVLASDSSGFPSEKITGELNDAFRNWAASLNDRGHYLEAFLFISAVSRQFGFIENNHQLLFQLANNHLVDFFDAVDYPGAEDFLTQIRGELLPEDWNKLSDMLIREQVLYSLDHAPYEDSLALVRQAWREGHLSQGVFEDWAGYLHQKKAIEISRNEKWWEAWSFLLSLPAEEASISKIRTTASQMKRNWAVSEHNRFVDAIGSENFDLAREIIDQALLKDPRNTMLNKDSGDLGKMGY